MMQERGYKKKKIRGAIMCKQWYSSGGVEAGLEVGFLWGKFLRIARYHMKFPWTHHQGGVFFFFFSSFRYSGMFLD